MKKSSVTVIGLGQMGRSIAMRLHDDGWNVNAFNRTPHPSVMDAPYPVSNTLSILEGSGIILISLFDENSICELLLGEEKYIEYIEEKSIVIDTTTHNPDFARELHDTFAKRGIVYLDAPVSGGPLKARQGELTVMVGGDKEYFSKYIGLFDTIGSQVYYLGTPGSGQAAKLVNQVLVGISQLATAEAIMLGREMNLNLDNLIEVIKNSAGDSVIFRRSAPQMTKREYSHEFQTHLIAKDLREIVALLDRKNLELPMTTQALLLLSEHIKGKFNSVDAASIMETYLESMGTSGVVD